MSRHRVMTVVGIGIAGLLAGLWWALGSASTPSASPPDPAPAAAPKRAASRPPAPPPASGTSTAAPQRVAPVAAPPRPPADEAPEAVAEWIEDVGRMLVHTLDPDVDPADIDVACSDDGRLCTLTGPLIGLDGRHALMARMSEAVGTGELRLSDISDLAHSRVDAHPWDDGGPGFRVELGLDPVETEDAGHGLAH